MSVPSAPRPLPPRPNLEFERKEAKALLRRLRGGDPDAYARARARHPAIDPSPGRVRLADAQLVVAREYGFSSWPRLVRYFGDVERQRHGWRSMEMHRRDFYEQDVRVLVAPQGRRSVMRARALAAYVPRFYGVGIEEARDATVTEGEARLAVARQHGFASWESLLESAGSASGGRSRDQVPPMRFAAMAIEAGDLDELRRLVATHPELLHPPEHEVARGGSLMRTALHHERRKGVEALRPIEAM